ncbi:MAG: hypothetical protein METHP_01889 [Methanoregula sp. SKADARSKE-2]|nr:MAG: hypothetical protein METHP_01889 [Methanoregula sp. SKADARSKE-2]
MSVRHLFFSVILTLGILFTAGCMSPPGNLSYAGDVGMDPVEDISPVISLQQEEGGICIDNHPHFLKGEKIIITGTTSLPLWEEIWVRIAPPDTGDRLDTGTAFPAILAVRGPGNTTWSATADALLLPVSLPAHPYTVTAHAGKHNEIRACSNFSVSDVYPVVEDAPYTFTGEVLPGNITAVQVRVFGPSFFRESVVPVMSDGKFTYIIPASENLNFVENSSCYHIIVQYPHSYSLFDLTVDTEQKWLLDTNGKRLFSVEHLRSMNGTDALQNLTGLFNQPGLRDTYRQYDVAMEKGWMTIDPPGDQMNDQTISITGSTNLPAGVDVLALVHKQKFDGKGCSCGLCPGDYAVSGTIRVAPGSHGINSLQMLANLTGFEPDTYIIQFYAVLEPVEARQVFNITGPGPAPALPSQPSACPVSSPACVAG